MGTQPAENHRGDVAAPDTKLSGDSRLPQSGGVGVPNGRDQLVAVFDRVPLPLVAVPHVVGICPPAQMRHLDAGRVVARMETVAILRVHSGSEDQGNAVSSDASTISVQMEPPIPLAVDVAQPRPAPSRGVGLPNVLSESFLNGETTRRPRSQIERVAVSDPCLDALPAPVPRPARIATTTGCAPIAARAAWATRHAVGGARTGRPGRGPATKTSHVRKCTA